MARVTVEDCIVKVPNRFDLVMVASQRARDLSAGAAETVERDDDKGPVIALREIAAETLDLDEVKESLVRGLQRYVPFDEDGEEDELILSVEAKVAGVETAPPAPTRDPEDFAEE